MPSAYTKVKEQGKVDITLIQPKRRQKDGRRSHHSEEEENQTREFISWDGEECKDAGYCLFGNSKGLMVRAPHLSSEEMLDIIIETGRQYPKAFHVGYAFYYDVNWIVKDLPKLRIAVLHKTGKVSWHGYTIEHIPHKIFIVSKQDETTKKRIRVRIDDCFTYFRTRFDKALVKYGIGTEEEQREVTDGKDNRNDFWWRQIDEIESYWRKELKLLVGLMERIRQDVNAAGFNIGQWHGPGALASYALRMHEMGQFKKETPEEVLPAVLSAYTAGWFERFKAGVHEGPVWTADINSAYVYAISLLPNLADGDWEHVENPSPESVVETRFAVYHIKMHGTPKDYILACRGVPGPLPLREKSGTISHPVSVDAWYWAPEAALVAGKEGVEIVEAWVFHDDGSLPFAWVAEDYRHRLLLQRLGNPAEKVIKWMLASLYGRLAQRVGWDEAELKPPRWHQLEWAGFITSMCRSMCYRAAMDVARNDGLVSIDTDGIMSTVPFDTNTLLNGEGTGLGEWKVEQFTGMIYIQNGIYWLKDEEGNWIEPKLRGIPKEQVKDERKAMKALASGEKIEITKRSFIGYGQALQGDWGRWRTWEERPHVIDIESAGKRVHAKRFCRACREGYTLDQCLHDLAPVPQDTVVGQLHVLPWMDPKRPKVWEIVRDYALMEDL